MLGDDVAPIRQLYFLEDCRDNLSQPFWGTIWQIVEYLNMLLFHNSISTARHNFSCIPKDI